MQAHRQHGGLFYYGPTLNERHVQEHVLKERFFMKKQLRLERHCKRFDSRMQSHL